MAVPTIFKMEMIKTINCILILIAATTILSCSSSDKQKVNENHKITYREIEKASWLIGKWENKSSEGNASEIWEKKNDSTLAGISNFIIGEDTVSSETISLEQNSNKLFYIPTVKGQNNEQPVRFVLTSSTNNQLVFENPEHDFPQKITYTQIKNDYLLAEISGMINGKQNSRQFPMTRKR